MKIDVDSPRFQARFVREVAAAGAAGRRMNLSLDPGAACCLVAQLQLAQRHPRNAGPARLVGERVIAEVLAEFADLPVISAVLRAGNDVAGDTVSEEDLP